MTKEEIKEMIDSTINGNGKQEITGHSLNLALNAIVDSVSDNNNYIYGPNNGNLTNSEYEHNIQMFSKIMNNLVSGNTGVLYFLRMPSIERLDLFNNESCFINDLPINFLNGLEDQIIFTVIGYWNDPRAICRYNLNNNGDVYGDL